MLTKITAYLSKPIYKQFCLSGKVILCCSNISKRWFRDQFCSNQFSMKCMTGKLILEHGIVILLLNYDSNKKSILEYCHYVFVIYCESHNCVFLLSSQDYYFYVVHNVNQTNGLRILRLKSLPLYILYAVLLLNCNH